MTTNKYLPLGFRNASSSGKVHGYSTHRLAYVKTKRSRFLKNVLRGLRKCFGIDYLFKYFLQYAKLFLRSWSIFSRLPTW